MTHQMSLQPHEHIKTLRVRVKDKHAKLLSRQAREVNQVWNYCNDLAVKVFNKERKFLSAYDLAPYTAGATKEGLLSLHSQTVQAINEEYIKSRKAAKQIKLQWRKSGGARRSLGWIPFKASALKIKNGKIWYQKVPLSFWDSYGLSSYQLGSGSFAEDAQGHWFLNVTVKFHQKPMLSSNKEIALDPGLKTFATGDQGQKFDLPDFYRDLEEQLAVAQRANKKQRVRAIHAKIKARRRDALHKLTMLLVNTYGAIYVGNVSAESLAKNEHKGINKSAYNAAWSIFRTQLQYKCAYAGSWYSKEDESFSTQECSCCHELTGPKGVGDLGIREWTCSCCSTHHERDVNSARNILARGHARLAVGIIGL